LMKTPLPFCRVVSVSLYQAPAVDRVKPNQIPAGREVVELVLGGTVRIHREGQEHTLSTGALFWEREGDWTLSETSASDPYRCLAVHFDMLARPPFQPAFLSMLPNTGQVQDLAEDLLRGFHGGGGGGALFSTMAYSRLAWAAESSRVNSSSSSEMPMPLRRILDHLPGHLDEKLGLAELATLGGVSPSRVHQLFREQLGETPHQYLLSLRLRESRILLARGQPAVKQVAADCGFASPEVFCRAFRKSYGLAPGMYRNQYQRPSTKPSRQNI
jgi:AraC-like DNA-binding protein